MIIKQEIVNPTSTSKDQNWKPFSSLAGLWNGLEVHLYPNCLLAINFWGKKKNFRSKPKNINCRVAS